MTISEKLLEVSKYDGEGYLPMIRFEEWRVAVLRYCDELLPQNICKFQKHNKTDEVFVLLAGSCTLFLGDGSEQIGEIHGVIMEPLKLYNIKKGTWHSHTLSKNATVLIVENENTCDDNSPEQMLTQEQRQELLKY